MIALISAAVAALALSVLGTRGVKDWLVAKRLLDHPNERSSHTRPTPRGGGLAITPVILVLWVALGLTGLADRACLAVAALAGGLFYLSWRDDRAGLPASVRLAVHLAAGLAGTFALPADGLVFQGILPLIADRLVAALVWVWFTNLYNFMDGIDGITGVETLFLALGLMLLATGEQEAILAAVIAAAAVGFLFWNWHPAKIFLGDSGSIPLGFLLGWLLLSLAARGAWAPACILPAYYLADATITLARRALRGEKVWEAHREHFYQKAVQGRASHSRVAAAVGLCDLVLLLLAILLPGWPAVPAAIAVVGAFLAVLIAWSKKSTIS